jgi:hypothetical protein
MSIVSTPKNTHFLATSSQCISLSKALLVIGQNKPESQMAVAVDRAAIVGLMLETILWGKCPFNRLAF